jgi:hypothetical protein
VAQSAKCLTTDWTTEVRSPIEAEDFSSSLCVQTGSVAHPASCPIGTGILSPGVKRGRGVMLTTHPHLVLRLRMSRAYTSSPPCALMACSGITLPFHLRSCLVHTCSVYTCESVFSCASKMILTGNAIRQSDTTTLQKLLHCAITSLCHCRSVGGVTSMK